MPNRISSVYPHRQRGWRGVIASSNIFAKVGVAARDEWVEQMVGLHGLADGVNWTWRSVDYVLTGCQQTLYIFHTLGHLPKAGQTIYGEGTDTARAFLERGRQSC